MARQEGSYRFGDFRVDPTAYTLRRAGEPVPLSPRPFDLLVHLLRNPRRLVTKDELLDALWPGVAVTENTLTRAVSELRRALGDTPGAPRCIETVPRRGYRWIAATGLDAPAGGSDAPRPPGRAVAVVDFANLTGDDALAWLAPGIAETVTNDLRTLDGLRVIDRWRVVEAAVEAGPAPAGIAAAVEADLVVAGSYQRMGDRLRVTARMLEAGTGDTVADAKADGRLDAIFELEDQIVRQFSAGLGLDGGAGPRAPRETSSLDAYRAAIEGYVQLQSLDARLLPAAVESFERAVALDRSYAPAYAGLANAEHALYELTRAANRPDRARLESALLHAHRAVELNARLAGAHATLGFLLVSAGRRSEALAAARRAVDLDPHDWMHLFILGHASWGGERLRAQARSIAHYAEFAFAHFSMAMVHVARNDLPAAERVLREGTAIQDRQLGRRQRLPSSGLHWLLGCTRFRQGDADEALREFDLEMDHARNDYLYAQEYTEASQLGRGFAFAGRGRCDAARDSFDAVLRANPDQARAHLGLALLARTEGRDREMEAALARAEAAMAELDRGGRIAEAAVTRAGALALRGRRDEAVAQLDRLLNEPPIAFAGWTIPVEPLLEPLSRTDGFDRVLARLADRAR